MMRERIKRLLVVFVAMLASFAGTGSAFADMDGMDSVMTISPPKQTIVLTPGEDFEGSIMVSSASTAKNDLVYSVTVGSFSLGKDENGNTDYNDVDVDTVTGYNQIMDWIELKKDKGTVTRGSTDTIPYVIHVPKNAPAGGQYATIIVQNDTEDENANNRGVVIQSKVRFASNIFAEVTGDTDDKASIVENNIPSFLLTNQLNATSTVKNDGNVHTDAEYVLQVWPLFSDEEICTNEETDKVRGVDGDRTKLIMPGTERYHTLSCNLPSIGIFRAKQTVKVFGDTNELEKIVIVCPLWLLFLILFVIIALIIWIIMRTKRKSNRQSHKETTVEE